MTSNGPCTRMTRCFRVVDLWVSIFIFPSQLMYFLLHASNFFSIFKQNAKNICCDLALTRGEISKKNKDGPFRFGHLLLCTNNSGLTDGFEPMGFELVFSKIQCVLLSLNLNFFVNLGSAILGEKHNKVF